MHRFRHVLAECRLLALAQQHGRTLRRRARHGSSEADQRACVGFGQRGEQRSFEQSRQQLAANLLTFRIGAAAKGCVGRGGPVDHQRAATPRATKFDQRQTPSWIGWIHCETLAQQLLALVRRHGQRQSRAPRDGQLSVLQRGVAATLDREFTQRTTRGGIEDEHAILQRHRQRRRSRCQRAERNLSADRRHLAGEALGKAPHDAGWVLPVDDHHIVADRVKALRVEQQRAYRTNACANPDGLRPQRVTIRRIQRHQRDGVGRDPGDHVGIGHGRRKLPRGRTTARLANGWRPAAQPAHVAGDRIESRHHTQTGGRHDVVLDGGRRTQGSRGRQPHATRSTQTLRPSDGAIGAIKRQQPRGALQSRIALARLHDDEIAHHHGLAVRKQVLEVRSRLEIQSHIPQPAAVVASERLDARRTRSLFGQRVARQHDHGLVARHRHGEIPEWARRAVAGQAGLCLPQRAAAESVEGLHLRAVGQQQRITGESGCGRQRGAVGQQRIAHALSGLRIHLGHASRKPGCWKIARPQRLPHRWSGRHRTAGCLRALRRHRRLDEQGTRPLQRRAQRIIERRVGKRLIDPDHRLTRLSLIHRTLRQGARRLQRRWREWARLHHLFKIAFGELTLGHRRLLAQPPLEHRRIGAQERDGGGLRASKAILHGWPRHQLAAETLHGFLRKSRRLGGVAHGGVFGTPQQLGRGRTGIHGDRCGLLRDSPCRDAAEGKQDGEDPVHRRP